MDNSTNGDHDLTLCPGRAQVKYLDDCSIPLESQDEYLENDVGDEETKDLL